MSDMWIMRHKRCPHWTGSRSSVSANEIVLGQQKVAAFSCRNRNSVYSGPSGFAQPLENVMKIFLSGAVQTKTIGVLIFHHSSRQITLSTQEHNLSEKVTYNRRIQQSAHHSIEGFASKPLAINSILDLRYLPKSMNIEIELLQTTSLITYNYCMDRVNTTI